MLAESKVLDSYSSQLLMREAYEQAYGLFDHEKFSERRPLAIVAMHPKENASVYSSLYRIFYKYRHLEIEKHWGLSIGEFLSYPREYVELIFRISEEQLKREAPIIDRALREMNNHRPDK